MSSEVTSTQKTGYCLNVESSAAKWTLTAGIGVAMIAAAALTLYFSLSFTSLGNHHFFNLLTRANFVQKITVIVVSSTALIAGTVIIVLLHKPKPAVQFTDETRLKPTTQFKNKTLNSIASNITDSSIIKYISEIDTFLFSSYEEKAEYYDFYYHLAQVSKTIDAKLRTQWKTFLKEIHGKTINQFGEMHSIKIDCDYELYFLNGGASIALEVSELTHTIQKGYVQNILQQAFNTPPDDSIFDPPNRCFIVCTPFTSQRGSDLLGCLFLREREDVNGKTLYIHSLARRADVVDFAIANQFKESLSSHFDIDTYTKIWGEVEESNIIAMSLFNKLDFVLSGDGYKKGNSAYLFMHYDPHGENATEINYIG